GIAHDPEAIMAMAAVQRETFLRERTERPLRRWRELVAEVAVSPEDDAAVRRWLGVEHVRLGRAFKAVGLDDSTLVADAARWIGVLAPGERDEILSRFDLDLTAPLRGAAVPTRG